MVHVLISPWGPHEQRRAIAIIYRPIIFIFGFNPCGPTTLYPGNDLLF